MSKRRFRVEPHRYGGELIIGKVNWEFAESMLGADDDAVWEALEAWENTDSVKAFTEETGLPPVLEDEEPGKSWSEYDDFEHHSGGFSDCEWLVTEVPADGSDDFGYGYQMKLDTQMHPFKFLHVKPIIKQMNLKIHKTVWVA